MKFKEIEPGMIIHCQTEEDARALLEYLRKNGYYWVNGARINDAIETGYIHNVYKTENADIICLRLDCEGNDVCRCYTVKLTTKAADDETTEFSDLIIDDSPINSPTDSPMSAEELLRWMDENKGFNRAMQEIFNGYYSIGDVFDNYSANDIIQRITAYEAAKKAKPVEVEWVNVCEIVEICDNGTTRPDRVVVSEFTLIDGIDIEIRVGEILEAFKQENPDWNVYAVIERRCIVKEGES